MFTFSWSLTNIYLFIYFWIKWVDGLWFFELSGWMDGLWLNSFCYDFFLSHLLCAFCFVYCFFLPLGLVSLLLCLYIVAKFMMGLYIVKYQYYEICAYIYGPWSVYSFSCLIFLTQVRSLACLLLIRLFRLESWMCSIT